MLNKEVVIKKTLKMMIVEAVVNVILWSVVVYICLTLYLDEILDLLNSVLTLGNSGALVFTICVSLLIVIASIFTISVNYIQYSNNDK